MSSIVIVSKRLRWIDPFMALQSSLFSKSPHHTSFADPQSLFKQIDVCMYALSYLRLLDPIRLHTYTVQALLSL
jgi:hypothetical protein